MSGVAGALPVAGVSRPPEVKAVRALSALITIALGESGPGRLDALDEQGHRFPPIQSDLVLLTVGS